ncbi:MAG: hypothetical protein QM564_01045 [Bergeyella sp.]
MRKGVVERRSFFCFLSRRKTVNLPVIMNIPVHILNFLQNRQEPVVSGFGEFRLKTSGATLNEEGTLLPPAKEVEFIPDFGVKDSAFISYLADTEKISVFEAELELKKLTNQWKNQLENQYETEIPGIGIVKNLDGTLNFKGIRIEDYGLEEISLSEIKRSYSGNIHEEEPDEKETYRFNNSILWIFLIAVPVAGLAYLGITRQEKIFGKKSFENISVKTSTKRITETPKQDSAKAPVESLKTDSLHTKITR